MNDLWGDKILEGTYHSVFDIVNMFVTILVAKYFVVRNGIVAKSWCWNKELKEMNRGYIPKDKLKSQIFLKAIYG